MREIVAVERTMGTVVSLTVWCADEDESRLRLGIARARDTLSRADAVFSLWRHDSPMNRFRRGEVGLADTPDEVGEVLSRCRGARDCSDGWFDPWAIQGGVDPTGFVKGWAAEHAADVLARHGATAGMVNAGGDIATFGRHPSGRSWRVGVRDPSGVGLAAIVEVDGAIATSGTYERGAHLVDPRTGWRCRTAASATVVGPDLGLADALATGLAVAGARGLVAVDALGGYEAMVIESDGTLETTSGFALIPA